LNILEAAMDDDKDKNVVEKFVDKINDMVEKVVTTASDAAQHAMEPDPVKPDRQAVAYMPTASDGFVSDPMMPVHAPKKKRTARKKVKTPAKKVAKEPGKKTDKKSKKPAKKSAKKTTNKKNAKKGAKKMRASKR
jgi:hypothetical protein